MGEKIIRNSSALASCYGSLSLDLDNLWSYLKTHGDPAWETLPTYLPLVVPRILRFLSDRSQRISFFIVGIDADSSLNIPYLQAIAEGGHEVGSHSFHHDPWLQTYSEEKLDDELERAERAIHRATGVHPVGFRGPGFTWSPTLLKVLVKRGYRYDGSSFPTFLGPLARAWFFSTARLTPEERQQRQALYGAFTEGFRKNYPHRIRTPAGDLLEIPVTTLPMLRLPFHVSYILYLCSFNDRLGLAYFQQALNACGRSHIAPSLLLHPLDFLGKEDAVGLDFFPAMQMPLAKKLQLVGEVIDRFRAAFHVVTMIEQAEHVLTEKRLSWT